MSAPEHDCRIDYIELPSADLPAVKTFYAESFGWRFTDWGEAYTSFEDGRLTGGFTPNASVPHPLVVLYATDLEATQAVIEANGGEIVRPIFSFPGGRRFHFTDPAGNHLAVWSDR